MRPAERILDQRERSRPVGQNRQFVEQRTHQVAAAVVEARDLAGLEHRILGRVLGHRERVHHNGAGRAPVAAQSIDRQDTRHFVVMTDQSPRLNRIRVRDCMHHGMLSCGPDDSLRDVAAVMANHRVHAVLVSDRPGGRPLGVVNDLAVTAAVARGEDDTTARAAAGPEVTVSSNAPVQEAARLMSEHHVSHLLVVEGTSGYPAGVLSTLDLARVYASR